MQSSCAREPGRASGGSFPVASMTSRKLSGAAYTVARLRGAGCVARGDSSHTSEDRSPRVTVFTYACDTCTIHTLLYALCKIGALESTVNFMIRFPEFRKTIGFVKTNRADRRKFMNFIIIFNCECNKM